MLNTVNISGETHTIPSVSPYTIRLAEVPLKETPSSISLTISGVAAEEVSSAPAKGQFWADYSTGADGDDDWNTGTILFNAADAGKIVVVAYKGTGGLVDSSHRTLVFLSSGTITAPAWATHAFISGCGGGGGGGSYTTTTYTYGFGGSAGGQVLNYMVPVNGGSIYQVTIGAGGTGAPSGSTEATSGGTTSFGSLLSLIGGNYGSRGGGTFSTSGIALTDTNGTGPCVWWNVFYDYHLKDVWLTGVTTTTYLAAGRGLSGLFGKGGAARAANGAGNLPTGYGSGGGGGVGIGYNGADGAPGILVIRWVA